MSTGQAQDPPVFKKAKRQSTHLLADPPTRKTDMEITKRTVVQCKELMDLIQGPTEKQDRTDPVWLPDLINALSASAKRPSCLPPKCERQHTVNVGDGRLSFTEV